MTKVQERLREIVTKTFRHGIKAHKLDLVSKYHNDNLSDTLGTEQALSAILACVREEVEGMRKEYNIESDYITDEYNLQKNIEKCEALADVLKRLNE